MKIYGWLDEHLEETLLIILLILIACVELIQVVIRNIPWIPSLTWAEEFCRFCWIWSVFLSLPYTIRKASMLRVSVLVEAFPDKVRKTINIAVDFIVAASMLVLGISSVSVVRSIVSSGEKSPAMLWPMWTVYSIMLVGFFLGTARALQQAWIHIRSFKEVSLTASEHVKAEARDEAEQVMTEAACEDSHIKPGTVNSEGGSR